MKLSGEKTIRFPNDKRNRNRCGSNNEKNHTFVITVKEEEQQQRNHPGTRSKTYSWLSLSRPRLSRITAYLEVKIWSLSKHENLTTGKKNIVEKRRNCSWGAISPLFHNISIISLTSRVQLHIYLLNVVVRVILSSFLQNWYVEVRISRSISESPLVFEITRVDCIMSYMG